jgi:hypothetical protein
MFERRPVRAGLLSITIGKEGSMSSSSKRRQTFSKMTRERAVKERRERKQEKKEERKQAAADALAEETGETTITEPTPPTQQPD